MSDQEYDPSDEEDYPVQGQVQGQGAQPDLAQVHEQERTRQILQSLALDSPETQPFRQWMASGPQFEGYRTGQTGRHSPEGFTQGGQIQRFTEEQYDQQVLGLRPEDQYSTAYPLPEPEEQPLRQRVGAIQLGESSGEQVGSYGQPERSEPMQVQSSRTSPVRSSDRSAGAEQLFEPDDWGLGDILSEDMMSDAIPSEPLPIQERATASDGISISNFDDWSREWSRESSGGQVGSYGQSERSEPMYVQSSRTSPVRSSDMSAGAEQLFKADDWGLGEDWSDDMMAQVMPSQPMPMQERTSVSEDISIPNFEDRSREWSGDPISERSPIRSSGRSEDMSTDQGSELYRLLTADTTSSSVIGSGSIGSPQGRSTASMSMSALSPDAQSSQGTAPTSVPTLTDLVRERPPLETAVPEVYDQQTYDAMMSLMNDIDEPWYAMEGTDWPEEVDVYLEKLSRIIEGKLDAFVNRHEAKSMSSPEKEGKRTPPRKRPLAQSTPLKSPVEKKLPVQALQPPKASKRRRDEGDEDEGMGRKELGERTGAVPKRRQRGTESRSPRRTPVSPQPSTTVTSPRSSKPLATPLSPRPQQKGGAFTKRKRDKSGDESEDEDKSKQRKQ